MTTLVSSMRPRKQEVQEKNPNNIYLDDVLKNSYAKNKAKKMGDFELDEGLSNDNQQVYFNPKEKKLLYSITGTHNLSDVGTDLYLAAGNLKGTNRYKEAEKTFKQAKEKYGVDNATIAGHSLGASLAGYIGNPKKDQIYTLDKGATIGQPVRKGENAFRTSGDAVSLLNANSTHMTTLDNTVPRSGKLIQDVLNAHNVSNISPFRISLY